MAETRAPELEAKLQRVAAYEQKVQANPVTALVRRIAPTKAFAAFYRWYGPKADPWLLHRTRGAVASRLYGLPVLLLHSTGAKTGRHRVMPLLYVRDGDDLAVVGTNWGRHQHPGWTANLLAHPQAAVELGPERLAVRAEPVDQATWERLWPQFVDVYPGYADYLGRTGGRVPRMFRLRLVG